jgi:hypothetical protein
VAAWVSAGLAPLREAVSGAVAPSDFPGDFVPAARRARGERAGTDLETGNREAAAMGAPTFAPYGAPYHAHPPPALMVVRPLVPLGFRGAALAWLGLSLLAAAVLAWIVTGLFVADRQARFRWALLGFVVVSLWPPLLHNFEKGQWSVLIAALLALAWTASARGWDGRAGALIAAAGCFKVLPFMLLGAFLARPGRWRVLAGALVATVVLVGLSAIVVGLDSWSGFAAWSGVNATGWQTAPANTLSLWGALARLAIGGPYARAAFSSPSLARLIWGALALALLGLAARQTIRTSRTSDRSAQAPPAEAFAAWSVLAVVLGPLSWTHTSTWLILPVALLLRSRLGARARLGLAAAVVLLTVPRLSLLALAGPWPVSPVGGLALGLHLVGALAVFAVACARPAAQGTTP